MDVVWFIFKQFHILKTGVANPFSYYSFWIYPMQYADTLVGWIGCAIFTFHNFFLVTCRQGIVTFKNSIPLIRCRTLKLIAFVILQIRQRHPAHQIREIFPAGFIATHAREICEHPDHLLTIRTHV